MLKQLITAAVCILLHFHSWCQSTTIGPEGGQIRSADALLTVMIPAGALDKPTLISIGMQKNSHPAGIGQDYELLPHTMRFKKPVSLKFSYKPLLDSISFSCGLQIAYLDSSRRWKIRAGRQHDEQSKTLTITTNHFSKWCLMESLKLSPSFSRVQPAAYVYFKVTGFVPPDADPCSAATKDIPVMDGQILPAERIKSWTLLSSYGTLYPTGGTAAYQAPTVPPQRNSITVMVELKSQPFPLLAKVEVTDASYGMVIQFGQEPNLVYQHVEATKDGDTYNIQIYDDEGISIGSLSFSGKLPGLFNWTGNGSPGNNHFSFEPPQLKRWTIESYYEKNGKALDSFGFITAKREGNARELLSGEFSITNAGKINRIDGDGTYEGEITVVGRFRVVLHQDR